MDAILRARVFFCKSHLENGFRFSEKHLPSMEAIPKLRPLKFITIFIISQAVTIGGLANWLIAQAAEF